MRRWLWIITIVLATPAADSQQKSLPLQLIPLLVELDGEKISEGISAYSDGKTVWLPLRQIANLLEIPLGIDITSARAEGWLFDRNRQWFFDADRGVAKPSDSENTVDFRGEDYITENLRTNGEVHVKPVILETLWPVRIEVSSSDLLVSIEGEKKLPRQRRLARERRRTALNETIGRPDRRSIPRVGTAYHWWQPLAGTSRLSFETDENGDQQSTARITAQGELAGATTFITASAIQGSEREAEVTDARLTFKRFASPSPMTLGIRKIEFGDLRFPSSEDIQNGATGVGVTLSTRPLRRSNIFEGYTLEDDAEPGSEVELYRDDELIDFTEVDSSGRYQFENVPIQTGVNNLYVVVRTPDGRRETERYRRVVGRNQIPVGETRFDAKVLRPGNRLLTSSTATPKSAAPIASINLDWGIKPRTTTQLEIQHNSAEEPGQRAQYVRFDINQGIGSMESRFSVLSGSNNGVMQRLALRVPNERWPITADIGWSDEFQSPAVGFDDRAIKEELSIRTNELTHILTYPIRLRFEGNRHEDQQGTKQTELTLGQSGRIGEILWRHRLQHDSFNDASIGRLAFSDWLTVAETHRLRWSGEIRYSGDEGIESARLSGRYPLSTDGNLNAALQSNLATSIHQATLTITDKLAVGRYSIGGFMDTDGEYGAQAALQFYFADRRDKPPKLIDSDPTYSGRLEVRVFLDRNRNGSRDADEPAISDISLAPPLAGQGKTNSEGVLMITGLDTHRYYRVDIEGRSLTNPLHRPANSGKKVWVRPGSTPQIDLAIVPTGAIYGHARLAGGRDGAEGVPVRLVNCDGDTVDTTRTRYNGFFSFEGLEFGRYWLRVNHRAGFRALELPEQAIQLTPAKPYESNERLVVGPRDTLVDYGTIQGTVIAPNCESGLGNVAVLIESTDSNRPPYRVQTGPDGHFQLDRLAFGRYRVSVNNDSLPPSISQSESSTLRLNQQQAFIQDEHIRTGRNLQ